MKNNSWFDVWEKRNFDNKSNESLLQKLIWMNGFDTPLGSMNVNNWKSYVETISKIVNIKKGDSIFELGCGAGSFLYPFYEKGLKVAGLDFSNVLIKKANEIFSNGNFTIGEANSLNPKDKYDIIFSNHVIHYFESKEYASQTINLLFKKSRREIYISGIPDINFKKEQEMLRKGILSEKEYRRKYKGLDILYFDKKLKLDDPVGAISAHGIVGILGVMVVPFTDGDASFLWQFYGVVAIAGFTFITSLIAILVINAVLPIRASDEEQELGLDVTEIGIEAYPEFK